MDFRNRVALITGAAVGIGRAAALKFAEYGANIIIADVNEEKLNAVIEELKQYDIRAKGYVCNVCDEAQVREVIADSLAEFGKIDILVNNAALWRCWSPFVETPVDEWKKFMDVNIMGTVYFTKMVLPGMIERGYGRIINVASVAGVYGNANMVHYSATKGAVIAMTKALAKEVARDGVTVNSISPGSVSPSENGDPNYSQPSELSFMGRTGTDRENASLICYIASEEAGYISGQNIQIDGCRKKQ